MSRTGRACDLVYDFKNHDVAACTDQWCNWSHITDEWELVNAIIDIDPHFQYEEVRRLRAQILELGGDPLLPFAERQSLVEKHRDTLTEIAIAEHGAPAGTPHGGAESPSR